MEIQNNSDEKLTKNVTQILHIKYADKVTLTREAGRRQADGVFVGQNDYYPISQMFIEILSKSLNVDLPETPSNVELRDPNKVIPFSFNMPESLKIALEHESTKRKANGEKNWSQNSIAIEFIEKYIAEKS